ncbi:exopolysaccharide biosynthesis protein [Rhizobium sp. CSW-27]|uniref:exopolysaccharide biosynthesis protein n=1 Tax=Rhizobium sp. CSW-27 TaxID=2839985 RepID=UPI001C012FE7|nr:exopolysaccharide biosynthesis protein [Rhizobium sp. CSW-27]MBT9370610.1 exopolysaccharide biosynthesis protein [Rhizobium sp. CSW-27]
MPDDDDMDPTATGRQDSFSTILRRLAEDEARTRIAVADLLEAMKDRAFGALLFIFAMPNTIPTPPGTSAILGIPLVFLSLQMALGQTPWLPKVIAGRSMLRTDFAAMIDRASPWIIKAERMLKPRYPALSQPAMERLIGVICLVLSIILALPIPLGNMLPAVALCVMAFGILEKDGVWVVLGVLIGIASLFLVAGVLYAIVKALIFFAASIFA